MPRIWEGSIDAHRDAVKAAIVKATAAIVHRAGLGGLSMSALAAEAGVSRATLYRYVDGPDAAIQLWHAHGIEHHLRQLRDIAAEAPEDRRLQTVLERYALNRARRHGPADTDLLHSTAQLDPARREVRTLIAGLLDAEQALGRVRADMPIEQLASYVTAAMEAARDAPTPKAARALAQLVYRSVLPPS